MTRTGTGRGPRRWRPGLIAGVVLAGLLLGHAVSGAAERIAARRVNDGDTIQLTDGRLVRYIGIDAPEIDHDRNTAQPLGVAARTRNGELVAGRALRLEFDIERSDDYGRTLAYVFVPNGVMVNERLLQEGLAFCLATRPNVKYESRLLAAQRAAMRARIGLWRDGSEPAGRYVGNRNSLRFHRAECPEAKRIARRNRVMFSKRWDAFWSGYAPSRECRPGLPGAAD